jgi:hypothetical protein
VVGASIGQIVIHIHAEHGRAGHPADENPILPGRERRDGEARDDTDHYGHHGPHCRLDTAVFPEVWLREILMNRRHARNILQSGMNRPERCTMEGPLKTSGNRRGTG